MMNRHGGSPQLRPYYDDQQPMDSGDELEPFDFGETSDGNGHHFGAIQGDNEDDLKNDETFGFTDPITIENDGMALLSERTKMLDLGDFGHVDKNFDWPDPSTIPLPTAFLNTDRPSDFAAWVEQSDLGPSTSVFGGTDLFMFDSDSKSNDLGFKFDQNDPFRETSKYWDRPTSSSSEQKPAANNLFDLFAQNNHRQAEPQKPAQKPQVWTEEMLLKVSKEEEEEKRRQQNALRLLGLSTEPKPVAQAGFEPIEPRKSSQVDPYALISKMPPPNVSSQQNYYQNVQPPGFRQQPPNQYRANYVGRGDYSRNHNMPPNYQQRYPPQKQHFNRPPPNSGMMSPFNGISPNVMHLMNIAAGQQPSSNMHQYPPPGFNNGSMYPPFQQNMLSQQLAAMSNSLQGSNASLSSRTKRPFLPSTKTLSDFAFDPYAGLMSKKEREWLIKIQLIQCMITGDPIEDDYYYSVWKERNVLKKAPAEWKVSIQPKYYNFENTYPSDRYVPPIFSGSLGKPAHSSTAFPRQIIDIHSDSIDEDAESNAGKSISQKKLRAILLRIENASLSLLECRDFLYKSTKSEVPEEETRRVASMVSNKIQAIINCVATAEELPTVMLVQKGRYLIGQLITYSDDSQASEIMTILVKITPRFAHRIPSDSNNQPLLRALISRMLNMDLDMFKMLRESFSISSFESLLDIAFVQQLCLAFMIGLCGREIPPSELITGPIGKWLSDDDPKRLHALFHVFNQDAVDFDLLRLNRGLSYFPPNSIARQLSDHITRRFKQRPT